MSADHEGPAQLTAVAGYQGQIERGEDIALPFKSVRQQMFEMSVEMSVGQLCRFIHF